MVCRQERISISDARRHAAVSCRRRPSQPHRLYVAVRRCFGVRVVCCRCHLELLWFAVIQLACLFDVQIESIEYCLQFGIFSFFVILCCV